MSGPCQVAVEGGGWGGGAEAGSEKATAGVGFGCEEDEDDAERRPVHRVVVGAGVAGTCCAEELCRLRPDDRVTLLTAADVVKVRVRALVSLREASHFSLCEKPVNTPFPSPLSLPPLLPLSFRLSHPPVAARACTTWSASPATSRSSTVRLFAHSVPPQNTFPTQAGNLHFKSRHTTKPKKHIFAHSPSPPSKQWWSARRPRSSTPT